jgi:hypothetical protein
MGKIGTWRMLRIFPAKVDFFWFYYYFRRFSVFSALTQNLFRSSAPISYERRGIGLSKYVRHLVVRDCDQILC